MDENTELLLRNARPAPQWEDEDRANYDLEAMRSEFRSRLYPQDKNVAEAGGAAESPALDVGE